MKETLRGHQPRSRRRDGTQLALQRIEGKLVPNAIVVIEIGGNDMLGSTTSDEFEKHLDRLLANLKGETRCLVMFELPLLPNKVAYGRIQRRLSKKHNVFLIPKLYLANVITSEGATEDGLAFVQTRDIADGADGRSLGGARGGAEL
jgi:acyl-CoA thioesterase-1